MPPRAASPPPLHTFPTSMLLNTGDTAPIAPGAASWEAVYKAVLGRVAPLNTTGVQLHARNARGRCIGSAEAARYAAGLQVPPEVLQASEVWAVSRDVPPMSVTSFARGSPLCARDGAAAMGGVDATVLSAILHGVALRGVVGVDRASVIKQHFAQACVWTVPSLFSHPPK